MKNLEDGMKEGYTIVQDIEFQTWRNDLSVEKRFI